MTQRLLVMPYVGDSHCEPKLVDFDFEQEHSLLTFS